MKKLTRSFFLRLIGILSVAFALLTVLIMASSPGMGEVSSILHGAFTVLSASVSGLLALIWLLILLWRKKAARYPILAVLLLIMAIPVIVIIQNKVQKLKYQHEAKRRNSEIASVATDFIMRMKTIEDSAAVKIQLRLAFDQELRTRGLYSPLQQQSSKQFYWLHNLYIWVFVDKTYRPDQLTGIIDFPDSAGCKQFQREFKDMLSSEEQRHIFSSYCNPMPHYPD